MKRALIVLLLFASLFASVSPAMARHRYYGNYSRNAVRRAYLPYYASPYARRYGYGGYGANMGYASPFVNPSAIGFGPYGN